MFKDQQPPVTIKVVDWADEEGARFGRSLLGSVGGRGQPAGRRSRTSRRQDRRHARRCAARERRRALADARIAEVPEGDQRQGLPRAAHRAGPGARIDEQIDRRRARHLRRRAASAALRRPGRAFGLDADPDAPRRVPRRRRERARLPRDREEVHHSDRARRLHGRHREGRAGHRHGGSGRVRNLARSARARRRRSSRRCWPTRAQRLDQSPRDNNVTVEWKRIWSIEPRPFDPTADRALRGGGAGSRPATRRGCRPARCTMRPKWCRTCRSS